MKSYRTVFIFPSLIFLCCLNVTGKTMQILVLTIVKQNRIIYIYAVHSNIGQNTETSKEQDRTKENTTDSENKIAIRHSVINLMTTNNKNDEHRI